MFCICVISVVFVGNVVSSRRTQVVGNRSIVYRRFASPALTFKPMQSVRLRLAKQVNRSRTKKKRKGMLVHLVFFVPCPEASDRKVQPRG